ncbi:hypothetical protein B0H19DRAFT_1247529 [Mycena capillaripes]|nr:hypothetical protein B0H19DRAFT_1247529 [Mycena capillaripes]
MAANPFRKRIIDDTDPAVQYDTTGWFVPVLSALEVETDCGIGTSIRVYGTIMVSTDANNMTDPKWDCFVDGTKIGNPQPTFKFPENNWILCDEPEIAAGLHALMIQVQSKGCAFYFDYLVYTPLPDATFETAVLIYPNTDPAVSFGSGWRTFGGDLENGTNTKDSQVALNFHGTSVSLYGVVPADEPHNSTWSTYSIDGGPLVNFTLTTF